MYRFWVKYEGSKDKLTEMIYFTFKFLEKFNQVSTYQNKIKKKKIVDLVWELKLTEHFLCEFHRISGWVPNIR